MCAEEREHTAWGRRGGEETGKGRRGEGRSREGEERGGEEQGRGGEERGGDTHYSEFKKLMGGL